MLNIYHNSLQCSDHKEKFNSCILDVFLSDFQIAFWVERKNLIFIFIVIMYYENINDDSVLSHITQP